jgi:hypothetical protein
VVTIAAALTVYNAATQRKPVKLSVLIQSSRVLSTILYESGKAQESPEGHVQCNLEYLDGSPDTIRYDFYLTGSFIVIPYDWELHDTQPLLLCASEELDVKPVSTSMLYVKDTLADLRAEAFETALRIGKSCNHQSMNQDTKDATRAPPYERTFVHDEAIGEETRTNDEVIAIVQLFQECGKVRNGNGVIGIHIATIATAGAFDPTPHRVPFALISLIAYEPYGSMRGDYLTDQTDL